MLKVGDRVLTKIDKYGYYVKWCGAKVSITVPKGTRGKVKVVSRDHILVELNHERFVECKVSDLRRVTKT